MNEPGYDIYSLEQAIAALAERASSPEGREGLTADGVRILEAAARLYDLVWLLGLRRAA